MTFNNAMLKTRRDQWDMVTPASKRADKSEMLVQSADKLFTSSPSLLRDRPFYRGRTQQITDLKLTLAYKIPSCSPSTQLRFPISSRSWQHKMSSPEKCYNLCEGREWLYNKNPIFQLFPHTRFWIKMVPFNNWCPVSFIILLCLGQQLYAEKHWDLILIHFTEIQIEYS